jgi:hypothetical protein
MGRRYRGKYNPKVRTKWDNRLDNRYTNDMTVSIGGEKYKDYNSRQIRFNTTKDDSRPDNRRQDNQFREHDNRGYNNNNDRNNWFVFSFNSYYIIFLSIYLN